MKRRECVEKENVTNVTYIGKIGKENETHKECIEKKTVTNDVTAISGDKEIDEAHRLCAEDKRVAYDVTPVN